MKCYSTILETLTLFLVYRIPQPTGDVCGYLVRSMCPDTLCSLDIRQVQVQNAVPRSKETKQTIGPRRYGVLIVERWHQNVAELALICSEPGAAG